MGARRSFNAACGVEVSRFFLRVSNVHNNILMARNIEVSTTKREGGKERKKRRKARRNHVNADLQRGHCANLKEMRGPDHLS